MVVRTLVRNSKIAHGHAKLCSVDPDFPRLAKEGKTRREGREETAKLSLLALPIRAFSLIGASSSSTSHRILLSLPQSGSPFSIPITRPLRTSAQADNVRPAPRGSPVVPPPAPPPPPKKFTAPVNPPAPPRTTVTPPPQRPRRTRRPLTFTEILQRQTQLKQQQKRLEQAAQEYQNNLQTSFVHPTQNSPPTSPTLKKPAFAPKPGTNRFLLTVARTKLGLDDNVYPFPESSPKLKGLPGDSSQAPRKKIYFRNANHFLLHRYTLAKYKAIVKAQKELPAKKKCLARRTAVRKLRKKILQRGQMGVYMRQLAAWKEGDETFELGVSMDDVLFVNEEGVLLREDSVTKEAIKVGAQALREGHAIAFPTETVYGLGANAQDTTAVEKIYKAKNRPADNPLITHFGSLEHLESFTHIPAIYGPLVRKFWPGPLTILLPVKPEMKISPLVTARLDTLAVRIPSSPLARALLLAASIPVAAPSANASTRPSPTMGYHVLADLNGRIPLILNADKDVEADKPQQCNVGLESTVVDGLSEPPTILRLGGISLEDIQTLGGPWSNTIVYQKPTLELSGSSDGAEFKPRTPGMKYRHYSPRCPVYLYPRGATQPSCPSSLLSPSSSPGPRKIGFLCTANWGPFVEDPGNELQFAWLGGDAEEIARNLFRSVRDLDEWGAEAIFVEGIEEVGIGRSVMERLKKMAAGELVAQTDGELQGGEGGRL